MTVGADACGLYVPGLQSHVLKLKTATCPEVDVPLLIATGYLRHRVASGSKLLIDLIAHLEMLERDARAYNGLQGFGT